MTTQFIDPRNKLFAHLDRLSVLQQGGMPAPLNVEIDLSNRCSLGCSWCHFAYTHVRGPLRGKQAKPREAVPGGDLMDTDLALQIIDQLADAGVKSITWTGGGEPTLHPDFDLITAYAGSKLEQGIYTHGGHITAKRAALMKQAFTFVYVSLDAWCKEQYVRDKRVDRFADACAGIANLAEAAGQATVGVGYLVTRDNWQVAHRAVPLAKALGADYIQFRPTVNYSQANPTVPDEDTGWLDEALEHLEPVERLWDGFVHLDSDRFRMYQGWDGHGYRTCWWSALQTVITPNGKVWTCVNKREHAQAELGDLSVESFADVWARRDVCKVDGSCRVMCRGHIPNTQLAEILRSRPHAQFV